MTFESITTAFRNWLNGVFHNDWLSTLITIVILVIVTALCAHLFTVFLRRVLRSNKGPLPAVSIFVNIGRVAVWVLGISIILSSCFGINVGAAVTALGVGGIAISLGFQETLSNLIGGLQIIMTGLIEPGDRIRVGGYEGKVHDVTWRHTTINTPRGEKVVIPNSVINTEALVKLAPENDIRVDIVVNPGDLPLEDVVARMQDEVNAAIRKIAAIEEPAQISVTSKVERGYLALLTFAVAEGTPRGDAIDAAMKAIGCSAKAAGQEKPTEPAASAPQARQASPTTQEGQAAKAANQAKAGSPAGQEGPDGL